MRRIVIALTVIALITAAMAAQETAKKPAGEKKAAQTEMSKQSPYLGSWKLNTEKSSYPDASMKPKSARLHITKFDENNIAWTYSGTDASGKAMNMSYSAPNDGKAHPVKGDPQMGSAQFKTAGNDVDITWKDAKGNDVGTEHATLAADGKSFSDDQTTKDKNGKEVKFTEVYEKASGGATKAAKTTEEKPADKK